MTLLRRRVVRRGRSNWPTCGFGHSWPRRSAQVAVAGS